LFFAVHIVSYPDAASEKANDNGPREILARPDYGDETKNIST